MPRRLYDISCDLLALEELLIDSDGEVTDAEAEELIDLKLEGDNKIDSMLCLVREFETRSSAIDAEIDRLDKLDSIYRKNATRIKNRIMAFFELHNLQKLNTTHFNISLCANGGKAPLVVPPEWERWPGSVDERFHLPIIGLDKGAIRDALESGEVIEGCSIGEREKHLRVK